tara:strand:+ start:304 stop:492 length:189 start_codon:yes stop_codon:yes gene_type:complete
MSIKLNLGKDKPQCIFCETENNIVWYPLVTIGKEAPVCKKCLAGLTDLDDIDVPDWYSEDII